VEQTEYQTVILAAFLHDIGKLLGRGTFKLLDKGQHPQFSATFVSAHSKLFSKIAEIELLHELVQKHHENSRAFAPEFLVQSIKDGHIRTLATLVSKADNLASSERGEASEQYQDYKTTPLCSAIERLDRESDTGLRLRFHPKPLSATVEDEMGNTIFAKEFKEYQPGEMNKLLKSFGDSFSEFVKNSGKIDFECFINHLTNLVYAHAWCIPSNTQEEFPDVSLFDHLKVTAGIAACLYQYHSQKNTLDEKKVRQGSEPRFLLVTGDISGIQQYIFGITSAAGGVARKLRARSLFVQLCTEVTAHKILHLLRLPPWNVIMNSGGNFYLLLPNLPEVVATLEDTQGEIDRWFINDLNGELALNLAWYPFGDDGFKPSDKPGSGFSNVLSEVKTILSQKKQNRFADVIQKGDSWNADSFVRNVNYEGKGACKSCYKFPGEITTEDGEVCGDCNRQSAVGARLPKSKYVSFFNNPEAGETPLLGYSVTVGSPQAKEKSPYLIMKLNDMNLMDLVDWPASSKYLATYVAQDKGQVLNFGDIAARAEGQHLLGFLKADVDRLGELFIFGLRRKDSSFDTISRQATLSRLLDIFFTGWLESLLNSKFKHCYTVFSGGDDLFFVGPWNEIIAVAEEINADFARFTGNPKISISAGIAITKPDYPIARAAELVERALKESKDNKDKDSITILGTTLKWADWAKVKKEWEFLQPLTADVPSAFLYNMLAFADMWRRYQQENDVLGLRYHPLLAYNVSRNLDPRRNPDLYRWVERILKWPPQESEVMVLDNLGLITTLCLYTRRGGER
jgi:CRISPR-associated protein Csm1